MYIWYNGVFEQEVKGTGLRIWWIENHEDFLVQLFDTVFLDYRVNSLDCDMSKDTESSR